jgi:outer membrane biosynthesis protein TonB
MSSQPRHAQALLLALAALSASGCHRQTAQAASPADSTAPEAAAPQPARAEDSPAGKNEGGPAPAAQPSDAGTTSPAPKPPSLKVPESAHPATKPPATTAPSQPAAEPPAPRPAPPLISPRISPAQQSERRQQAEKSIAVAENNLHRADGHSLNDAQRDMVEKIRSFLAQARDASEVPDWERAFVLAEKARVLSAELVNSL